MGRKLGIILIIVLAAIIVALAWLLFTIPAPTPPASQRSATSTPAASTTSAPSQAPTASTSTATSSEPLDSQVSVAAPQSGASVSHSFDITGQAPGAWFFEAVFPIQVRDSDDNLLGTAQGQAQGNWQTTGLVSFSAQMTIDSSYHGPANLILLKANPSGLPENVDSVTVPITIQ